MTELRAFNQLGIQRFEAFLKELRQDGKITPPFDLLENTETSYSLNASIPLETGKFETKLDAARFLASHLDRVIDPDVISYNSELWSWLSLFYFDEVCPANSSGIRKPLQSSVYVLPNLNDPEFFRRYYRHILAAPYKLLKLHGVDAEPILTTPVNQNPDSIETISSRQAFAANKTVIRSLVHLYYEFVDGEWRMRKGATNYKRPGTMRRFVRVYDQFDLTYDVQALSVEDYLELLPAEFSKWRS